MKSKMEITPWVGDKIGIVAWIKVKGVWPKGDPHIFTSRQEAVCFITSRAWNKKQCLLKIENVNFSDE